MSSLDVLENDTIETVCRRCRTLFYHVPKYVNGDPRILGTLHTGMGLVPLVRLVVIVQVLLMST